MTPTMTSQPQVTSFPVVDKKEHYRLKRHSWCLEQVLEIKKVIRHLVRLLFKKSEMHGSS